MKIHKISDFLIRQKDVVEIEENVYYKRLTIKTKNQGVSLRDEEIGANIGTKKQFIAKGGQFIVSKIDAMNGAFGIIPLKIKEAIITGNFWTYNVDISLVNIDWFNMFVSIPNFIKLCEDLSSGTTHRKYLDENKFSNYEILLPSISEQNDIVENYIKHKALSDNLLQEISKQEKYVSSLRQAILQQAVEGKLCEQDPTDESASVLLERIKEEKENLIAQKKIKKQKDLTPITEEEKPYDLPQGWEWCRLGDICDITDGTHQTPRYTEAGMPFLSAQNVKPFKFMPEIFRTVSKDDYDLYVKNTKAEKGDILMARVGAGIGEAAIIDKHMDFAIYVSLCLIKAYFNELNMQYILNWINGVYGKEAARKNTLGKGTSQGNLNLNLIRAFAVPLPPFAEQQRIVEKVDRLMALCKELEQEVTSAKKYASQLMEAVLQEAFANKPEETQNHVVVFAPLPQQDEQQLMAAARGNMKEDTWQRLANRALELANEDS